MSDQRARHRLVQFAVLALGIAVAWPALSVPPASAAGGSDTLWGWGDDRRGQLGVGGGETQVTPKRVLSGVTAISAGDGYTLAADGQGRAWSWGDNGDGQLGDGTRVARSVPLVLSTLPGITSVAAGVEHSLILTADGSVQAFGYGSYGSLGTGTLDPHRSPVDVVGLPAGITAISVGKDHSVALDSNGVVWAWGQNSDGQLGNGESGITALRNPVPISLANAGMPPIVQVQAATLGDHTVAVDVNGHVWTWGETEWDQTNGPVSSRATPGMVAGLENIVDVAAGRKFVAAVDDAGSLWMWGYNDSGQLGDGTTVPHQVPAPVDTPSGLTAVVDVCAGYNHVLARTATGELWAFGGNRSGKLGDGTESLALTPQHVEGLPDGIVACAAGDDHSLALDSSGGLWAWGSNQDGEIGDGKSDSYLSPLRALGPVGVSAIVASADRYSGHHSLAIDASGALWAWGENGYGQLGDDTRLSRGTAERVNLAGSLVTSAAVGPTHSLAVDSSGGVWAWGNNSRGQLGDDTTVNSASPVQVQGLPSGSKAIAVAAGNGHSVALLESGTVWGWGSNDGGQLGDGTQTDRLTPVQVSGLPDVTAISSNSGSNLALAIDGSVWGWGLNYEGQLGLPVSPFQLNAVEVSDLPPIVQVSLGGQHGVARDVNGAVWAWGTNDVGQVGQPSGAAPLPPGIVSGPTDVVEVSAGADHNLAVTFDGVLWAWGGNARGQLGDGTAVGSATPVRAGQISNVTAISAGSHYSLALAGPERTTSQDVLAGGAVSTDPQGLGATIGDPIQVTLASPNAGTVTIVEQDATGSVSGYSLLGKEMVITAPDGTPADPLVLVFEVDASIVPMGQGASDLVLIRNGTPVSNCAGAGATPEPCVESRESLLTGNVRLTVRTPRASLWSVALRLPSRKDAVLVGFDALVVEQGISDQVAEPLRVTLSTAATLAENDRGQAALNTIGAYQNKVAAALRSRKIGAAQAQALNGFASTATGILGL